MKFYFCMSLRPLIFTEIAMHYLNPKEISACSLETCIESKQRVSKKLNLIFRCSLNLQKSINQIKFDLQIELQSRNQTLDLQFKLVSSDGIVDLQIELLSENRIFGLQFKSVIWSADGIFDVQTELVSRDRIFDLQMLRIR